MKKIYAAILFTVAAFFSHATVVTVGNIGNTFDPANITITVGDTVQFNITASHNVVEVSQATYNANGTTSNGGFTLPFGGGTLTGLAAGTYYYVCTPHASLGMKGTITVQAAASGSPTVWINEIHYDNTGGDVDEGVEIAGPSGTDLSCYALMLYNGSDNELYGNNDSIVLSGTIDDEGCGYGAVWFVLPANGLQNGSPDGIGLWNHCTNTVEQFLSYEGIIDPAGDGPMAGLTSTDLGVYESGIQVVGGSLQLSGIGTSYSAFTWDSTAVNSYDVLNPNQNLCGAPADTTVSFQGTTGLTTESAGTYTLNLRLDQATNSAVSIDVDLLSGTAANLGNTFPETVNFAAGTITATLDIILNDDAVIEADETYEFILENGGVLVLGSDSIFTLDVEDDDTPTPSYTIGTVTTVDALGQPDSSGVECILYGVVNSPERGFNSTEFSMQDATGAITVYQGGTAITYEAAVGDSVEVIGEIDERFGVTVITNIIDLTLLTSGSSVTEAVATMPMESNESSLIRVNGLQMVDPSDWNAAGGAGFDVPVFTLANDTFVMRIDRDYDALYNSTDIPCGVFDVIGVAGQYDVDTPLFDDYQLLPRFLTDIIDTCTIVTPQATIGDATEVDANGDPLLFGSVLTLKGIITSPDFRELQGDGTEFSFADGTGGIWAFSTDSSISFNPVVGDSVEVSGEIYASSGVTRIRIASVSSLGSATPYTPTVVTTALDESHEAELITIEGLTLQGTWETSGGSYNVSASNGNGTYDIRVDADRAELFAPILTGGETFNLTGIGSQFDPTAPRTEGYQILPRFDSDIDIVNSIQTIELSNFIVSPVPANEVLNISFDYDASEVATMRLINVIGQASLETSVSLINGNNKVSLDVSETASGFYMLQIATEKGVSNTSVLIK